MQTEKVAELERRLLFLETEFAQERIQNQLRLRTYRRREAVLKLLFLLCLLIVVMVTGISPRFTNSGVVNASQRPVTVLEAPVLIVDSDKAPIVEISADKGQRGLKVNGPQGEAVFLGSSSVTKTGLIQILGAERKLFSTIVGAEVAFYNSAGKAVAGMGARAGGSGYATLGNANGDGVVEAGMTTEGKGIVRAYPLGGPPPMVIPNTIMGGKGK